MKAAFARFLALICAVALGACSTLGDLLTSPQPACEPATGQTFTVAVPPGKRVGVVASAKVADSRCVLGGVAAQVQLQAKVMCLAGDGQSLAVAWDAQTASGAVYVSSTKLPGCLK
jgi:hypothetical protein